MPCPSFYAPHAPCSSLLALPSRSPPHFLSCLSLPPSLLHLSRHHHGITAERKPREIFTHLSPARPEAQAPVHRARCFPHPVILIREVGVQRCAEGEKYGVQAPAAPLNIPSVTMSTSLPLPQPQSLYLYNGEAPFKSDVTSTYSLLDTLTPLCTWESSSQTSRPQLKSQESHLLQPHFVISSPAFRNAVAIMACLVAEVKGQRTNSYLTAQ